MSVETERIRLLIVGPSWVGDMVMSQALVALFTDASLQGKQSQKSSRSGEVHMLAPASSLGVASRMPGVDRCIEFPFGHGELKLASRRRFARSLEAYDQAIVLPNTFKSALVPFWAGIKQRTGWLGESRYVLLNDRRKLDKERYPLMVQRFAALGLAAGETLPQKLTPKLTAEPGNVERLRKKHSLADSAVILCPGAEFGPAKQWPATQYAHVADHYLSQGREVWILGSPKDKTIAAEILHLSAGGIKDLTGATSLTDAIDLLSLAQLVVCNDSGLMHVACALNVKVVAVFGSTSPSFTPPLNVESRVVQRQLPCSPCFQRECPLGHLDCLRGLPPVEVINAARDLGLTR